MLLQMALTVTVMSRSVQVVEDADIFDIDGVKVKSAESQSSFESSGKENREDKRTREIVGGVAKAVSSEKTGKVLYVGSPESIGAKNPDMLATVNKVIDALVTAEIKVYACKVNTTKKDDKGKFVDSASPNSGISQKVERCADAACGGVPSKNYDSGTYWPNIGEICKSDKAHEYTVLTVPGGQGSVDEARDCRARGARVIGLKDSRPEGQRTGSRMNADYYKKTVEILASSQGELNIPSRRAMAGLSDNRRKLIHTDL